MLSASGRVGSAVPGPCCGVASAPRTVRLPFRRHMQLSKRMTRSAASSDLAEVQWVLIRRVALFGAALARYAWRSDPEGGELPAPADAWAPRPAPGITRRNGSRPTMTLQGVSIRRRPPGKAKPQQEGAPQSKAAAGEDAPRNILEEIIW